MNNRRVPLVGGAVRVHPDRLSEVSLLDRGNLAAAAIALLFWLAATGLAAAAAPRVPEGARAVGPDADDWVVEALLLVDPAEREPGDPLRVGVLFELRAGWHLYWKNPGEAGLPTRLNWKIAHAEVGPILWPAPRVFAEADGFITTFGYSERVLLASDLVLDDGVAGNVRLEVDVDFLVCEIQCVPGHLELHRTVDAELVKQDASALAVFAAHAAQLPRPAEELGIDVEAIYSRSAIRPGDAFKAAIAITGPYTLAEASARQSFVPELLPGVELEVTGSRAHPFASDGLFVTLAGVAIEGFESEPRLRGVLSVRDRAYSTVHIAIDLAVPVAEAGSDVSMLPNPWLDPAPDTRSSALPLWQAIGLALLGGLILNLMPCVLPVLAVKVFSIAESAHQSRRAVLLQGAAYSAGILSSMLALAVVVVALRAGGTAVGWGFQFQTPLFVAAICTVLVLFALNLFGVFEIFIDATRLTQAGGQGNGARRSFFEGLLAVVVATPCSAPFLGTAVGFAFASSAPVIVGTFLAIGVGLAAPFVAVTLVPGWSRLIPRSGAWMLQLRSVLGFALLGTAVWLFWVLGQSVGIDGLAALLALLVATSLGAWAYGALQSARLERPARVVALLLAAVVVLGLGRLPLESLPTGTESGSLFSERAYAPEAIRAELQNGLPVFVYFTADWCLTCKVNEHLVLMDPDVRSAFEQHRVVTFVGDWTLRDESIRSELARFGRAGVPMYLMYRPGDPANPQLLPELLTVELLLDALRDALPAEPSGPPQKF